MVCAVPVAAVIWKLWSTLAADRKLASPLCDARSVQVPTVNKLIPRIFPGTGGKITFAISQTAGVRLVSVMSRPELVVPLLTKSTVDEKT